MGICGTSDSNMRFTCTNATRSTAYVILQQRFALFVTKRQVDVESIGEVGIGSCKRCEVGHRGQGISKGWCKDKG